VRFVVYDAPGNLDPGMRAKGPQLNAGDEFGRHSLPTQKSNRRGGALQTLDFSEVENASDVDSMANSIAGIGIGGLPGRRETPHTLMHSCESAAVKLDVDLQQFAVGPEKVREERFGHFHGITASRLMLFGKY
jgi:hypothetical protein